MNMFTSISLLWWWWWWGVVGGSEGGGVLVRVVISASLEFLVLSLNAFKNSYKVPLSILGFCDKGIWVQGFVMFWFVLNSFSESYAGLT